MCRKCVCERERERAGRGPWEKGLIICPLTRHVDSRSIQPSVDSTTTHSRFDQRHKESINTRVCFTISEGYCSLLYSYHKTVQLSSSSFIFPFKSWRMGIGWSSSICCPGKWMNAAVARQFCLSWGGRYFSPHYSPALYDSVQYTWSDTMKPYLRSEEKREESHITTFLHICHRHLIRLHTCTSPHKLSAVLLSGSVSGRVHAHVRLYLMNVCMFSHGCQFYCNPRASCCPPSFIWRGAQW